MVSARSKGDRIVDIIIIVVMIFLGIVMLYPMLYELMVSFSDPAELIRHRGILIWPLGFDTTAYQLVLSNHQILTGYANTLFILVVGLAFNIVLTCLGAYCLAVTLCWHRVMTIFVLITIYFLVDWLRAYLTVRGLQI